MDQSGHDQRRLVRSRGSLDLKVFFERFTHDLFVGSDAGPNLESNRSLIDEHAEPVQRLTARRLEPSLKGEFQVG